MAISSDDPPSAPARPTAIRRAQAVINLAAGGVGPESAEEMRALFDRFGVDGQVHAVEPDGVEQALQDALGAKPDLLVVLAGDGTTSRAADLCGMDGPLLAPLPGGSMNLLPRALYGARPWTEALADSLVRGAARTVGCGEVDGRRFYCAAILGSPALWQPAREAARRNDLPTAWTKAMFALRRAFSTRLRFQASGGAKHRAVALSLICPLVSRAFEDEACLEAASLNVEDIVTLFRLALNNVLSDWRRDPAVIVEPCVTGRAWARRRIPCLIDGEMYWLSRMAPIRFHPRAFRALAPAPDGSEGAVTSAPA